MRVHLCLNLEDNVFEIRHAMGDAGAAMSVVQKDDWRKGPACLKDIQVNVPTGLLTKDKYDDFFIGSYTPGTWSIHDFESNRALTLRGEEVGITRLVLHPKNSRVDFTYTPSAGPSDTCELFYSGIRGRIEPREKINIGGIPATAVGDKGGLSVSSDVPLRDVEEIVRLSWGVVQGGPITLRVMKTKSVMTINMCSHTGGAAGTLYKRHEDSVPLFQKMLDFFCGLPLQEYTRWKRASHFYLAGAGGVAVIEIRYGLAILRCRAEREL